MSEGKPNIIQRLLAVQRAVPYIQTDKRVEVRGGAYRVTSYSAVMGKLKGALLENGILFSATVKEWGQDGNRTTCTLIARFHNADDPSDVYEVEAFGFGVDGQDKGPGKAQTYAKRYALLNAFALEVGDDPEDDHIDHVAQAEAPPVTAGPAQPESMTAPAMIGRIVRMLAEMEMGNDDMVDWLSKEHGCEFGDLTEVKQRKAHAHIAEMHKAYCALVPKGVKALGPVRETGVNPLASSMREWEAYLEDVTGKTKEATA